jgi:uncharacterized protein YggE
MKCILDATTAATNRTMNWTLGETAEPFWRKPMLKNVIVASCLLVLAGLLPREVHATDGQEMYAIHVQGEAKTLVAPDRAKITLGIDQDASTAAQAQDGVRKVITGTIAFLKSQGISDPLIQSTTLSINPNYRWDRDDQSQRLIGYRSSQSVIVTLEDLSQLQKVIDGALTKGISRLSPPELFYSQAEELKRTVLADAFRDALADAQALADAAGMQVGSATSIRAAYEPAYSPRPEMRVAAMAMDTGADNNTQYTGQIEINASVQVSFRLVP